MHQAVVLAPRAVHCAALNAPYGGWNSAGLPIGVQFIAPLNGEERLFALAGQLEAAQPWAHRRAVLPS